MSVNEKTDVLTHQQEDKDFAQSEITPSKNKQKKYNSFEGIPTAARNLYSDISMP